MRRPLRLLAFAALLAVASALVTERPADERLEQAARTAQDEVARATAALQRTARQWLEQAQHVDRAVLWDQVKADGPLVRVLHQGMLVLWTDRLPISDTALAATTAAHLVLADGIYLHAHATAGDLDVHALRRVWRQPPFENRYLEPGFEAGLSPADGVAAAMGPGLGPVVRDAQGGVMFRLRWVDDTPPPGLRSWISLGLALLAIACTVWACWSWAMGLRGPWRAVLAFVPLLLLARVLTLMGGPFLALEAHPLFDPSLFAASFLMPSLGDLLLDGAVLLCAAAFIHRALQAERSTSWPGAVAALALLCGTAAWIDQVLIALVRDSSVNLDLFHVQGFDVYSWLALLAIALLLTAWLVLADAMVRLFVGPLPPRLLALLVLAGTVAFAFTHEALDIHDAVLACWPAVPLALLALMHIRMRTVHVLALIGALAFFTAHVLNRQTQKRTERDRATLAESATAGEDPVIELLFREASIDIRSDPAVAALMAEGASCSAADLDRAVRQAFFTGYWERYDVRLHLFGPNGLLRCSTSPDAPPSADQVRDRFEQGVPTAGDRDLRSVHRPGEEALYLGLVRGPAGAGSCSLFVELRPRLIPEGLGFPELLLAGDRSTRQRPDRFTRARYERGALTESTGAYAYPITWTAPVPVNGWRYVDRGYDLLAQGDPHGTLMVLGMRLPTWLDHVTTFSYIFLFFCLLTAAFVLVRTLAGHRRSLLFSVRGKVRVGVMLFAIISLVLFAYGTQHLLDSRTAQRSGRALNERTRGALIELRQTLRGEPALTPAMAPYLDHLLSKLSNVFFTDLTLYTPDGLLLATSREQLFNTGLLGPRMDAEAYQRLALEGAESFSHEERIGTARFRASYMPFRNDAGQVLGYLALPYFARQSEMDQERTASAVAMVNLFTLLFLLSVVAAALITGWTTRPLQLLKRGLERIRLGAQNEPIAYTADDELGDLVRVYNHKVEELRISAEKLARSERESAWREMARQVAHEIKNPLTPMKLGIQHFQRTWDTASPDARQRLDRFSASLVEQIDALGRVANDFSQFAQMSAANETVLDLNDVAKSAVELFRGEPGAEVTLHPALPLQVKADREHLLRVFNNLIKNAVQAIPEERRGTVDVVLRSEGGQAIAEVRDNGTGITEEARVRIFTPSFTTKSSGTGLGLAMVKRLVEQAGGRVWFTTRTGEGTSFFLALPLLG
ncbi:MAG: sensor histidine kinase [Bacteroidetes bacterium]|nr:sensor histidine kinase [Bacteroidota bacterium]